jgi:hypothetical protein
VPFIDRKSKLSLAGLVLLGACSSPMPPTAPAPVAKAPASAAPARPAPAAPMANPAGLPSPAAVRSWNEVRAQAARRLLAANPAITYSGAVPDPLLAIPVLEIELNSDGSIRRVDVMRAPRQAQDTVQIAIDAVHRAAPFGDISRLPKPWKFTETFLFNDDRKFKPRTLDL